MMARLLRLHPSLVTSLVLAGLAGLASACASTVAPAPPARSSPAKTSSSEGVPVAFWQDRPIRRGDLDPAILELSGGVILREILLDRRIVELAAGRGITATEAMIEAERTLLLASLSDDPDRAVELLAAVRARQGLGEARFTALLRRNALLRAMIAGEVTPDSDAIRRIHDVRHGARRRARIVAVSSFAEAAALRAEIEGGGDPAEVAFRASTDPSRSAGGLIPPVTRLDPSWPAAFREALFALAVEEVSAPVLVDGSWLVVVLLEEIPADGVSIDAARPELERLARLQQERVLMDRIVRDAAASLDPRILDPALRGAWERLGIIATSP